MSTNAALRFALFLFFPFFVLFCFFVFCFFLFFFFVSIKRVIIGSNSLIHVQIRQTVTVFVS